LKYNWLGESSTEERGNGYYYFLVSYDSLKLGRGLNYNEILFYHQYLKICYNRQ
jgi:hypothetical protein